MLRLDKFIFTDPATQADDVWKLILFLLQSFADHLVGFLLVSSSVESEGVMIDDHHVLGELFSVGDGLKILNKLNDFIIVCDVSERVFLKIIDI